MKQILFALKEVLLSYFPARSLQEAMIKIDFKIGDARSNLMQLCFSNLASWPLVMIVTLIYFDPFGFSLSLVKLLSYENSVVLFLLDGRLQSMIVFFAALFLLEWLFRKEYIFLGLIFYFVKHAELHVHLATLGVLAVYLSRIFYLWWLSVDCESLTKKIWKSICVLQFTAWFIAMVTSLRALDFIQINSIFNENSDFSRFNFLILVVLIYHVISHLLLTFWGHFYFQKKQDSSFLPIHYSTAAWILRFNMSYYLQNLLKKQIAAQLENHLKNEKEIEELKLSSPGVVRFSMEAVLKKEISHLKEASLRLSKI